VFFFFYHWGGGQGDGGQESGVWGTEKFEARNPPPPQPLLPALPNKTEF